MEEPEVPNVPNNIKLLFFTIVHVGSQDTLPPYHFPKGHD